MEESNVLALDVLTGPVVEEKIPPDVELIRGDPQ